MTIFFDAVFAARYDSGCVAADSHGYRTMLEFSLGDDADVDAKYAQLTEVGYHGQMAPEKTSGPYAAMIDDPDGNVVLLTSDDALGDPR